MESLHRHLPGVLLALGAAALVASAPGFIGRGQAMKELPWLVGLGGFLVIAAYVWRRLPRHPVAWWFAVTAGTATCVQGLDGVAMLALDAPGDPALLAIVMLVQQCGIVIAAVAIAHMLGRFPDGQPQHGREVPVLRSLWLALLFPPLVLVSRPTVLLPNYYDVPQDVANPYALSSLASVGGVATGVTVAGQALFVVGVALLVRRYHRADRGDRRRVRWLLLPAVLAVFAVATDLLLGGPDLLLVLLWISTLVLLPVTIAVALLRPDLLDVDVVLRKSVVYGFLWLTIGLVYVLAATGLGVAAGQRFPIGVAITLTVLATLVFHPARRWLESLADRWVFGTRADPARLVSTLGAALEETVELEQLLPRMAETVRDGLGLRWARVRLEPAAPPGDHDPMLTVPITLGGERLGVVECGPKVSGDLTEDDEAVVATLARQAALAVRNLRLTAELQHSRTRLVRAQDLERRRIERDLHDGVQQGLVALIGHTAVIRSRVEGDAAAHQALTELQEGLRGVVEDLRELVHGIHPSLLSDRGLLDAVEALAARSAVPVAVRADPSLRGQRFTQEIETAGYFTVAESLANVGKHARATRAEVSLARNNGSLRIQVTDDGSGFDPISVAGEGLGNLADRLAALDGHLDVASRLGAGTTIRATLRVTDG
jgi:signal transduction histidine kinase